jgi:hypothetical protein
MRRASLRISSHLVISKSDLKGHGFSRAVKSLQNEWGFSPCTNHSVLIEIFEMT